MTKTISSRRGVMCYAIFSLITPIIEIIPVTGKAITPSARISPVIVVSRFTTALLSMPASTIVETSLIVAFATTVEFAAPKAAPNITPMINCIATIARTIITLILKVFLIIPPFSHISV